MAEGKLQRRRKQRLQGLDRANEVRRIRADLREAMKAGNVDPIALLAGELEPYEEIIEGWRLEPLLHSIPGIGSAVATEIYMVGKFSPNMRVRALSKSRREELARLCAQAVPRRFRRQ